MSHKKKKAFFDSTSLTEDISSPIHFVACPYVKYGCPEDVLSEPELELHVRKCDYDMKPCPGCAKNIPTQELDSHVKDCGEISIKCVCGEEVRRKKYTKHTNVCNETKLIACPNECGEIARVYEMEQHLKICQKSA
jgi:hypothetical protein